MIDRDDKLPITRQASLLGISRARRKVLAHRVAITLEAVHAKEALQEAIPRYGAPGIVNTGQSLPRTRYGGSQFTAQAFVDVVLGSGARRLCMDGRGAWRDNVFVERLWRSKPLRRLTPGCCPGSNRPHKMPSPGAPRVTHGVLRTCGQDGSCTARGYAALSTGKHRG